MYLVHIIFTSIHLNIIYPINVISRINMIYMKLSDGKMNHKSNRKCVLSTAKVGERGQIVIPKDIRDLFDIQSGDTLLVRGLEGKGVLIMKAEDLLMKADIMKDIALQIFENKDNEDTDDKNNE
jgi:AbrB family looped-hinge helix DNA binding protein